MRARILPLVLCAAVVATACQPRGAAEGPVPRIVVFQDGSLPDARDVVSPGVLGLQAGLGGVLSLEIVEAGGPASAVTAGAEAAAADPSVVAAVVAPFTAVPEAAVAALRRAGVPVLSLSSSQPVPRRAGPPWRSLVATISQDAAALARAADAPGAGGDLCVAGAEEGAWSASLAAVVVRRSTRHGGDSSRTATLPGSPAEVAAAAVRRACGVLVWTGDAGGAATVWRALAAAPDPPTLLVADRARTMGLLDALGPVAASAHLSGVCACADLATARAPEAQRFLHDVQAATGLDPGPFAAEGWDAGRALSAIVREGSSSRAGVAAALATRSTMQGVAGPYSWTRSGALATPAPRAYRAVGWRWLSPIVARGMSGVRADPSRGST
jgi:ABC-type branched-subunit amino acid transport system substrate-binding protein